MRFVEGVKDLPRVRFMICRTLKRSSSRAVARTSRSSVAITLYIYSHVDLGMQGNATDKLDAAFDLAKSSAGLQKRGRSVASACPTLRGGLKSHKGSNLTATWRSGYATVCKTVYPGSIPGVASTQLVRDLDSVLASRSTPRRGLMRAWLLQRRRKSRVDLRAPHQIQRQVEHLVVLRIGWDVRLRALLLVPLRLEMPAQ
jgi:hypothetical protein